MMEEFHRERDNMTQKPGLRFRRAAGAALLGALLTLGAEGASAQQPIVTRHIYPEISSAQADVRAAIDKARREHKRVIVAFGGDWCPDCQVLDIYFNQTPNRELLNKYFVKVNVNIGRMDANLDLAHKYGVPVHGVPALAVLDGRGKAVFAQDKEFADMRNMQSSDLTAFLKKWKP